MRRILLMLALATVATGVHGAGADVEVLAADGEFFYDVDDDCIGDTDDNTLGEATRHWHVGLPFVGPEVEVAAGFGCLGGPKSYDVSIPEGMTGTVSGTIRYAWDQNVPGGGFNDVHLNVLDAGGELISSTASEGLAPIIPTVTPSLTREVDLMLGAGDYTLVEDIFSGEHTAWLSNLTLTLTAAE